MYLFGTPTTNQKLVGRSRTQTLEEGKIWTRRRKTSAVTVGGVVKSVETSNGSYKSVGGSTNLRKRHTQDCIWRTRRVVVTGASPVVGEGTT